MNAGGEDDVVRSDLHRHAERLVNDAYVQPVRILRNFRFAALVVADKDDALLARLRVVALLEAVGPDVAVENVNVGLRRECLDHQGVLDRFGTAHA